jgi:hypothetical protein
VKHFFSFVFGFFCILFILSFLGQWSFFFLGILWSGILGLLAFSPEWPGRAYFLGCVLALEGLGTSRFGLVILFGALLLVLHTIFTEHLRFTSLVARFNLASISALLLYTFIFAGFSSPTPWIDMAIVSMLALVSSYGYTNLNRDTSYTFS